MSFWNKATPVMDGDRVAKGGMWPHQRAFWESKAYIKALVTGYGGGKTFTLAKRIIAATIYNAHPGGDCPSMVVSPDLRVAKRTIIPTLRSLLDGRQIAYRYNKTDHEIRVQYRGLSNLIWIASGHDPDSLKGPNLGAAGIDEPFIQPRQVFNQMMARIRHPQARIRELLLSGTPEQLNWGYDILAGDEAKNYDSELIQARTDDNLALPQQYIDSLRSGYDAKLAEAYLDGQFVNLTSGLVYYGFRREQHVVDLPDPGGHLCLGMDFNVDPMAAVVFWVKGDHMHYIDEIELPNSDTEEMTKEAMRRYPNRITVVYPDPSGKSRKTSAGAGRTDFTILKSLGLVVRAHHAAPSRRDRFNATNMKFQQGTLTMSPRCRKLAKNMEQLAHETYTKQSSATHLCDAATYAVEHLFPIRGHWDSFAQATGF